MWVDPKFVWLGLSWSIHTVIMAPGLWLSQPDRTEPELGLSFSQWLWINIHPFLDCLKVSLNVLHLFFFSYLQYHILFPCGKIVKKWCWNSGEDSAIIKHMVPNILLETGLKAAGFANAWVKQVRLKRRGFPPGIARQNTDIWTVCQFQ